MALESLRKFIINYFLYISTAFGLHSIRNINPTGRNLNGYTLLPMFLMDYTTHHPLPYHFLTRDIICLLLSTRNLLIHVRNLTRNLVIHVRNLTNIWVHNVISTRSDFLMLL